MARLHAMATSQDLVTASSGGPVALADVIGRSLAPFGPAHVEIDKAISDLVIRGEMAVAMGLLLHEMATNAVKYGALSNRPGRVAIVFEAAPEGRVAFAWRETGGPPDSPPKTPGFGTRILKQALRPHGGEVTFAFEPEGFRARAEFPIVR